MSTTTRPLSPYRPRRAAKHGGPSVPEPMPIERAMNGHTGLARLGLLLQESNRRMAIVSVALPGALTRFVKPGPIDEDGWTLLASNAAVAAKLRQLQPRLLELLAEQGIPAAKLRIKVMQPG
ncbi:flagellar hook-length control protein FliK [Paucibacter sp. O1-1]|nr:flagellar hook-length control protein FliK [Paucibacter sp. O1-1]MDA3826971.1 flagellar hook-length control protein FliK [Paucibacter sp. O1-1]